MKADYIRGSNPRGLSYMVGYGSSYPVQDHHRGASIVSIKKEPTPVSCKGGFDLWFDKNALNPNVLDGALVGGSDDYGDSRPNYLIGEPATAAIPPLIGVLASLA